MIVKGSITVSAGSDSAHVIVSEKGVRLTDQGITISANPFDQSISVSGESGAKIEFDAWDGNVTDLLKGREVPGRAYGAQAVKVNGGMKFDLKTSLMPVFFREMKAVYEYRLKVGNNSSIRVVTTFSVTYEDTVDVHWEQNAAWYLVPFALPTPFRPLIPA